MLKLFLPSRKASESFQTFSKGMYEKMFEGSEKLRVGEREGINDETEITEKHLKFQRWQKHYKCRKLLLIFGF